MSALHAVPTEPGKPAASVVYVTPEMAERWLSRNERNRPVRRSLVDMYARDMSRGAWSFTGEAVKFDASGVLLDGQHRLSAIVKSGATIPLLVIRGVAPEAQRHMDSGAKRGAADWLTMNGFSYGPNLAALARFAILVGEHGRNAGSVSHDEQFAWLEANRGLAEDAVEHACTYYQSLDATPTAAAYAWYLLARVDRADCITFFHTAANGMTEGPGDPRHTLTKRLAMARRQSERVSRLEQVSLIVRAWNAWRRKSTLASFRRGVESIPKAV